MNKWINNNKGITTVEIWGYEGVYSTTFKLRMGWRYVMWWRRKKMSFGKGTDVGFEDGRRWCQDNIYERTINIIWMLKRAGGWLMSKSWSLLKKKKISHEERQMQNNPKPAKLYNLRWLVLTSHSDNPD